MKFKLRLHFLCPLERARRGTSELKDVTLLSNKSSEIKKGKNTQKKNLLLKKKEQNNNNEKRVSEDMEERSKKK